MSSNKSIVDGSMSQHGLLESAERYHQEGCRLATAGMQQFLLSGESLIKAKGKVPHGQWLAMLTKYTTISDRTAQLYMKLARNKPALELNPQHVTDLTIREGLALIASASPKKERRSEQVSPARDAGSMSNAQVFGVETVASAKPVSDRAPQKEPTVGAPVDKKSAAAYLRAWEDDLKACCRVDPHFAAVVLAAKDLGWHDREFLRVIYAYEVASLPKEQERHEVVEMLVICEKLRGFIDE